MQFNSTDPDIETLLRRIDRNLIDLQPDFQRGEVWSQAKKQRLIDTILRGWHIPPIHMVEREGGHFDVLDGQQRLTAIREFCRGEFAVDGGVQPLDEEIASLNGMRWGSLPDRFKERVNNFTIRVFQLTNFEPSEPYELFFRLNQPTNLTEAEKRNAFVGRPRNQIKELVAFAEGHGMTPGRVGFSNSRMSYDETLARFVICLEAKSLSIKLTSARITERYRSDDPFDDASISLAQESIKALLGALERSASENRVKPNKATLHTWLYMAASALKWGVPMTAIDNAVVGLEGARAGIIPTHAESATVRQVARIFDDRATSRVLDVSSVVLRDLCGWAFVFLKDPQRVSEKHRQLLPTLLAGLDGSRAAELSLYEKLAGASWGGLV